MPKKMIGRIKNFIRKCFEAAKKYERILFSTKRRKKLKNLDFSIISSNCVGTIIYHDLELGFLSPTINLAIGMNDFVKLAGNLKWYMEQELVEIKDKNECPAGMLGDIRINFVHYDSFEEGARKWEERKERINWDNLIFIGSERGDCTYETLQSFDKLPCKNKVILTHIRYPEITSSYYIKGFENQSHLGIITNYKKQFWRRRYMDDFDYVTFLNSAKK